MSTPGLGSLSSEVYSKALAWQHNHVTEYLTHCCSHVTQYLTLCCPVTQPFNYCLSLSLRQQQASTVPLFSCSVLRCATSHGDVAETEELLERVDMEAQETTFARGVEVSLNPWYTCGPPPTLPYTPLLQAHSVHVIVVVLCLQVPILCVGS